ncbi:hypothetical protein N7520_008561 [Penicillium odoratum]|uniref:uncharacterized protein n=1 Tax=Penicillium odoratum TaxID=1167516 RepID=UPI0025469612|nr:uncharacterized protein N7520_008561 [Penicillium odoratum]KAJ5751644.1 hypothetical protein N7520_008561 [Penicillium odoratum]
MVLIQWENGPAWSRFQCSLGFSMLLGYLEHVTNRCTQLALPAHISSATFRLELFSYDFPASENTPDERQYKFKERWNSLFRLNAMNDLIYARGEWVEADFRSYEKRFDVPSTITEDFKVENHYFSGLILWKTGIDLEIPSKIADQFAILAKEANGLVISMTEQMRYEGSNNSSQKTACAPLSDQPAWDYPLLNTPVIRRCDLEDSVRLDFEDVVHIESMRQAYTAGNNREVSSPAGNWFQMGSMTQYELPSMHTQRTRQSATVLEVISFRLLHQTPNFDNLFAELRVAIWKLRHKPGVYRASDHNDPTRMFLLAGLGDMKNASMEDKEYFHQLIHDFENACRGIIEDLSYMQIPGPSLRLPDNLEITSFYVSNRDLRSFEYAYQNLLQYGNLSLLFSILSLMIPFTRTTRVQRSFGGLVSSVWLNAVKCMGEDYDGDLQITKYTSIWFWKSSSIGQKQWYAEFAERAQNEYENLGHIIDWLRTVCKSSHNVFLNITRYDPAIEPLLLVQ